MSDRGKVVFGTIAVLLFFTLVLGLTSLSDDQWAAFCAAHHCRVEGRITGSWAYKSWVPAKTLWRCDDGQIYGRDE